MTVGYAPDRLTPAPPFTAAAYLRHHARLRGLDGPDGEVIERLAFESLRPSAR